MSTFYPTSLPPLGDQPKRFGGSYCPEQRLAEALSAGGRVEGALIGRRLVGLDLEHDEGGAVALAQHARAFGEIGLARDRASPLDAGAYGYTFEVDTETGVALLIAGLTVMAVIDA